MVQHLIVMGVSGCGKSTLAQGLAAHLGWRLIEGDAFHPPSNLAKMAAGQPLTDADRAPWLALLSQQLQAAPQAVLACSALKAAYRLQLRAQIPEPLFVHCHGSFEVLHHRIMERSHSHGGHFMPASLLQSQFEALEMPNPSAELGLRYTQIGIELRLHEAIQLALSAM